MLKNQTEKVKTARNKRKQGEDQPLERQGQPAEQNEELAEAPTEKPTRSVKDLINVEAYFQRRKQLLASTPVPSDPISLAEQTRKFNAAVLRYSLTSHH
jgi:hypothetical protein